MSEIPVYMIWLMVVGLAFLSGIGTGIRLASYLMRKRDDKRAT